MGLIGYISYIIGWVISPGGLFGSLIHWTVRGVSFICLWALTYGAIRCSKWVIANPITAVVIFLVVIVICGLTFMMIKKKAKAKLV